MIIFLIIGIIIIGIIIYFSKKNKKTTEPDITEVPTESTKCNKNTYLKKGVCVPCPTGHVSEPGSISLYDCRCALNYYQDGFNCVRCPGTSVTSRVGSQSKDDCFCNEPGKYLHNDACVDCPLGTYSSDYNCVRCPNNRMTTKTGSTSILDCLCPDGSSNNGQGLNTVIGSCKCNNVDDVWNNSTSRCESCPEGSSVSGQGQNTMVKTFNNTCKCIDSSFYWDPLFKQCKKCPAGSHWSGFSGSSIGNNSCVCDNGKTWNGWDCS
jgi:hypothetical protein